MSLYQFVPDNITNLNHDFVTWENAFTDEELDRLVAYGDSLDLQTATVNAADVVTAIRRTKTGWINNNPESAWLYDRLAYVARKINSKFYSFDLYGFVEHMQYTVYTDDEQGFYTWHQDISTTVESPRKLSLILQLSDPADFDGGELETSGGPQASSVEKRRGLIAAFPSWRMHRVTPVTRGIRKTLVIWVSGPSFK